jgi:Ca-activated chloride channel family protein
VSAPARPVADFWIPSDTGSYAAIRGAIDIGKLPAPESVKIEELLNHDIAALKPPATPSRAAAAEAGNGNSPLITTVVEAGEAPWARGHRLVRIGLKAAAGAARVVAKDIKVEVEFNPRRVAQYRLIGYERPSSATSKRVSSAWTAGTIEAGRVVTALFEIVPMAESDADAEDRGYGPVHHLVTEERSRAAAQMLTLRVQYRNAESGSRGKLAVAFVDAGTSFAATSDDFKFAAGVAAYGMILRDSPNRGVATLDNAIAWATAGVAHPGDDVTGQRGQLIELMRRTRALLR